MDTRFPPPPKKVNVALYPQKTQLRFIETRNAEKELLTKLAAYSGIHRNRLALTASASAALYSYLIADNAMADTKIAVPTYCCPSLIEAIVKGGCEPVFYDIDSRLNITIEAVDYVIENKCGYIVWPNYFGYRERSKQLIKRLKKFNIKIIFDEAQSFPIINNNMYSPDFNNPDAILLSFGCSKPVAGAGGGALLIPHETNIIKKAKNIINQDTSGHKTLISTMLQTFTQKITLRNPHVSWKIGIANKPEKKLDTLLIKKKSHWSGRLKISPYEAAVANDNIIQLYALAERQHARYLKLKKLVASIFDKDAFQYVLDVNGVPSILAIKLNPKERYDFFLHCSRHCIQVTWYYYPLHLIHKYSKFITQPLDNSIDIACSVAVLPFQWHHSDKEFDRLMLALSSYERKQYEN